MTLSIVIPCYNEAKTILNVLKCVKAAPLPTGWSKEIIIVDDGSDAATRETVSQIPACDARVITRAKNGGKGAAVKDGLSAATGDYCIIQDADLEYNPDEYAKLLAPIIEGAATAVFGSRNLGTNKVPFSKLYFYGGLMIGRLFNLALGTHFSDITTCYKLFPRKLVPELATQPSDDFVFDAVELTRVIAKRERVSEIPITYHARSREEGKKLNWRHGVRAGLAILFTCIGLNLPQGLRVLKFLISGSFAAAINVVVLYIATEYGGMWYLHSAILSFSIAFIASFLLTKFWMFEHTSVTGSHVQAPLHLGVAIVNLGINTLLMYALVDGLAIWYVFAQVLAAVIIAFESFFAYRWIYDRKSIVTTTP